MVEYVVERFLRPDLVGKELYVIDNENVNGLVKFYESLDLSRPGSVDVLVYELLGLYVIYSLVAEQSFDVKPYGVAKVCLSQACFAVYEQWIEGCGARTLRYLQTYFTSHKVALSNNKVVERIFFL